MQGERSCAADGGGGGSSAFISSSSPRQHNIRTRFPCFVPPSSTSVSFTPSPCSCNEQNNALATENRLYLARITLEYQQLVDRYGLCLTHLQDAAREAEILGQENAKLRMANKDLMKRLTILTQASVKNRYLSSAFLSLSIINDFCGLGVGDNGGGGTNISTVISETSPPKKITERGALPKSISIRSTGYLKQVNQSGGGTSDGVSNVTNNRPHVVTAPIPNKMQRVYVPRGNKEEGPLEFDVYNQVDVAEEKEREKERRRRKEEGEEFLFKLL